MREKIAADITAITLNTATFSGTVIQPTMINFFFGKNGAGKTSIAKAIKSGDGLTWEAGKTAADYEILLYNQEFIDANISQYENLPGVFTVNETNIEIQKKVADLTAEKRAADDEITTSRDTFEKKKGVLASVNSAFMDTCWAKTKRIRETFDATQKGRKHKDTFRDEALKHGAGVEHDFDELKALYDTAYDPNARAYTLIDPVPCFELPTSPLLSKRIVSSSDTSFARFVTALQATDWVRRGHELFAQTPDCKCPYCQQRLPDSFETDIASCFDEQYQAEIRELQEFRDQYRKEALGIWEKLKASYSDVPPTVDIKPYTDQIDLFIATVKLNLQRLDEKIKEPAQIVELDRVSGILNDAHIASVPINQVIEANNMIVYDKQKKQQECFDAVWELIAFVLHSDILSYQQSVVALNDEMTNLLAQEGTARGRSKDAREQITELNKKTVNTEDAIRSINALLLDSGFQGFKLRAKPDAENVYEVIRPDGSLAVNLSEGERNFIAFLYFYHLVRGSSRPDGKAADKIVVIDDPVSSMDSGALFLVSALVREMVEVCHNNMDYLHNQVEGDYIKQIFILTHNTYFHREVSYNQEKRYDHVSFFLISKTENVSSVSLCVRDDPKAPSQQQNYNPVQNSYAALWSEYREVSSPITVLNVIRRILEYYFLQLCGYDGANIRQIILTDNKPRFITTVENGQPDYSKYHLADAMLQYLSTSSTRFIDGLNYVEDCTDVEQCRHTFRLIFDCMGQLQHYQMMMGEQD